MSREDRKPDESMIIKFMRFGDFLELHHDKTESAITAKAVKIMADAIVGDAKCEMKQIEDSRRDKVRP